MLEKRFWNDNVKFWVGPVIEDGFFYDIDLGDDVIFTYRQDDFVRLLGLIL